MAGIDGSSGVLEPRVGHAIERELPLFPERLAAGVVFDEVFSHVVDADAVQVVHRALQVPATVPLSEVTVRFVRFTSTTL